MRKVFRCEDCDTLMEKVNENRWECPECDSAYVKIKRGWVFLSSDDDDDEDGFGRPKVCTGCGSDMYPDCSYSCKLFDD